MARLAMQVMLGRRIADLSLKHQAIHHYGIKEAVFPFNMFPEVDPLLGPEMRSTGEVLGISGSYGRSFFKAQEVPTVLVSESARHTRTPEFGTECLAREEIPVLVDGDRVGSSTAFSCCHRRIRSPGEVP